MCIDGLSCSTHSHCSRGGALQLSQPSTCILLESIRYLESPAGIHVNQLSLRLQLTLQVEQLVLRNQDLSNKVKLMQQEALESRNIEQEMARRNSILQNTLQNIVSQTCCLMYLFMYLFILHLFNLYQSSTYRNHVSDSSDKNHIGCGQGSS